MDFEEPLLHASARHRQRPNPDIQRWRDRRLRLALLALRLLSFLDGLMLLGNTSYVAWEEGLLGFIQDDAMPLQARVLEAFTFVLPWSAGSIILWSSASVTVQQTLVGMRLSEASDELRTGPAGPISRCALLMCSALSVMYLRSVERYNHGLGFATLGRLGEMHGLGLAALVTLVNAVLQLRTPIGVPEVPAAAAITRLARMRQRSCELSSETALLELPTFACLFDLLPSTDAPALLAADPSRQPCTHRQLHRFVSEQVPAELASFYVSRSDRIAVAFPNGPESATAILAVLAYATLVPLSIASTALEMGSTMRECGVTALLLLDANTAASGKAIDAARQLDLLVIEAESLPTVGLFTIRRAVLGARSASGWGVPLGLNAPCEPLWFNDCALLLQTSGTTGNKKTVPHLLEDLIVGAVCLAASGRLGPGSVCCNIMPLFHVGGIMRCILAPLLAGGAVVAMPYFDPHYFWTVVEAHKVTWYYATPTLHHSIYVAYTKSARSSADSLRMIWNAGGPLSPALAVQMRDMYSTNAKRCVVMPSYGMTECMPIAAPPDDYNLEHPGSSGRALGPELQIHNDEGEQLPHGTRGHVALRGSPLMKGYEGRSDGFIAGWFHTGDEGYIDEEGWLYIVGRSKEVINRGGETIAPVEIEEVLITHPLVHEVAAFATPHATLQEAVGVCVVPVAGAPRVELRQLAEHAARALDPAKWPVVLVHAPLGLPRNATSKVMRVKMAERMGLPVVEEATPEADRVFEALEKPGHTNQEPIPTKRIEMAAEGTPNFFKRMQRTVSRVWEWEGAGDKDISDTERTVQRIWLTLRASASAPADERGVPVDEDLMLLGGTSIKMGALASQLSAQYGVSLSPVVLFAPPRTIRAMAAEVDALRRDAGEASPPVTAGGSPGPVSSGTSPPVTASQFSTLPMLVQALPALLWSPLSRLVTFSGFTLLFVATYQFIACLLVSRIVASALVMPLSGIAVKWLVIGRYRAGTYPLWGSYYLRWWIVDQTLRACGRGPLFDQNDEWRCRYLRLLGARVGSGVKLASSAHISEADLVSIGDDVAIDTSTISAFAADAGAMVLQPVALGKRSGVCCSCALGPGSSLAVGTCLGPLSSAHEPPCDEQSARNRKLCRPTFAAPPLWMQWVVGWPCIGFVSVMALMPYLLCLSLVNLMPNEYRYGTDLADASWLTKWDDRVMWLTSAWRVRVILLCMFVRATISPFVRLAAVIAVKRLVIGRFKEGHKGQWQHFQYWLMKKLIDRDLCGTQTLLARHWGGVSVVLQLLGAKCGRRIFWPGVMFNLVEFDLLTVGDDVVFGSRSTILCSDTERSAAVVLAAGAMVADRCVLLPGVTVGRRCVLGSGSVTRPGRTYPSRATTLGSYGGDCVVLDPGSGLTESGGSDTRKMAVAPSSEAPDAGGSDTSHAFGRTFYGTPEQRAAALWWVPPPSLIVISTMLLSGVASCIDQGRFLIAVCVATQLMVEPVVSERGYNVSLAETAAAIGQHLLAIGGASLIIRAATVVGCVAMGVGTKWLVIGERKAGEYLWDRSSYCMRWKIYSSLERSCIDLSRFVGSGYIVLWYRAIGGKIGADVCLFPQGSDLMLVEPELITIGDGVCVNNQCSLICHLNTRGAFSLGTIAIGARTTVRSFSRVMADAVIDQGVRLLEHTLVMAGERVPEGETRQGWPTRVRSAAGARV